MFPLVSRLSNAFLPSKIQAPFLLPSRFVRLPTLNQDYWVVHNVLSQKIYDKLSFFTKAPAISARRFRELLPTPLSGEFTFSSNHCLENEARVFNAHKIHDPFLQFLYHELIDRFAKQMKLTGVHEITLEVDRYTPSSNVAFSQDWHFDTGSLATLVMVLHNDFTYIDKNGGLDISFNEIKGSFSAFEPSKERDVKPLNEQYVSVEYPENGAIIVRGDQGHVIHRMSTLAARTFPSNHPCYRVIAALVLKDLSWQQQSRASSENYLSGS